MLPVRNRLVINPAQNAVLAIHKEELEEIKFDPNLPLESITLEAAKLNPIPEIREALIVEPKKTLKKRNVSSNTELFLEELHTLVESWAPQSNDWEGDRRPILYDFECRDEVRKLMQKHGM